MRITVVVLIVVIVGGAGVGWWMNWNQANRLLELRTRCLSNLLLIDSARQQVIEDLGLTRGDEFDMALFEKAYGKKLPKCPAGFDYSLNNVGEPPTCSCTNLVWLKSRYIPFYRGDPVKAAKHEIPLWVDRGR